MDKLFIDCNILLDWLIVRAPFSEHAEKLFTLIEQGNIQGYVSPLTLANTYYILRKQTSKRIANEFLNDSLKIFKIIGITKTTTVDAIKNKHKDFEDDLHYFTADENNLNYIVTRNKSDFIKGKLKIVTAEEYLHMTR